MKNFVMILKKATFITLKLRKLINRTFLVFIIIVLVKNQLDF